MVGKISLDEGGAKKGLTVARYGPLSVAEKKVYLRPEWSEGRKVRAVWRAERALGRAGVQQVILPRSLVGQGYLRLLQPVKTLHFYRGCADLLALGYLEEHGIPVNRSRVALSGRCPGAELRQTAERLCPYVRELVIRVPEGGERFARQLHTCHGLSVLPPDTRADLSLCFSPTEGGGEPEFHLYGEMPRLLGMKMELLGLELPEDCSQELLSLLWEHGWADRRRLRATICPQTLVNGGELCYNY